MRKFFIRLLCCFIPLKAWRKKVRTRFSKSYELKEIFLEVKTKKSDLYCDPSNVEDLFIGSSHIDHGIIPHYFSPNAFNLGSNSQDLKSSFYIYKAVSKACPNLKNIILGYSVFSPGFDVSKTSRDYIFDILNYHFSFTDQDLINRNYLSRFRSWERIPVKDETDRNGYLNPTPLKPNNVEKRVNTHLRENQRDTLQNGYVKKLSIETTKNNHNFYIVLMPARREYSDLLPETEDLFQNLFEIANDLGIPIINFWKDNGFNDSDFSDFDHLNKIGAEKLTSKIRLYVDERLSV